MQEERSSRREASFVNLHEIVNLNVKTPVFTTAIRALSTSPCSYAPTTFTLRLGAKRTR